MLRTSLEVNVDLQATAISIARLLGTTLARLIVAGAVSVPPKKAWTQSK
jgi:hypothetical protein